MTSTRATDFTVTWSTGVVGLQLIAELILYSIVFQLTNPLFLILNVAACHVFFVSFEYV